MAYTLVSFVGFGMREAGPGSCRLGELIALHLQAAAALCGNLAKLRFDPICRRPDPLARRQIGIHAGKRTPAFRTPPDVQCLPSPSWERLSRWPARSWAQVLPPAAPVHRPPRLPQGAEPTPDPAAEATPDQKRACRSSRNDASYISVCTRYVERDDRDSDRAICERAEQPQPPFYRTGAEHPKRRRQLWPLFARNVITRWISMWMR